MPAGGGAHCLAMTSGRGGMLAQPRCMGGEGGEGGEGGGGGEGGEGGGDSGDGGVSGEGGGGVAIRGSSLAFCALACCALATHARSSATLWNRSHIFDLQGSTTTTPPKGADPVQRGSRAVEQGLQHAV